MLNLWNYIQEKEKIKLNEICKFIANITPSQLFDVTQEEYIKKCNDSINLGKNQAEYNNYKNNNSSDNSLLFIYRIELLFYYLIK